MTMVKKMEEERNFYSVDGKTEYLTKEEARNKKKLKMKVVDISKEMQNRKDFLIIKQTYFALLKNNNLGILSESIKTNYDISLLVRDYIKDNSSLLFYFKKYNNFEKDMGIGFETFEKITNGSNLTEKEQYSLIKIFSLLKAKNKEITTKIISQIAGIILKVGFALGIFYSLAYNIIPSVVKKVSSMIQNFVPSDLLVLYNDNKNYVLTFFIIVIIILIIMFIIFLTNKTLFYNILKTIGLQRGFEIYRNQNSLLLANILLLGPVITSNETIKLTNKTFDFFKIGEKDKKLPYFFIKDYNDIIPNIKKDKRISRYFNPVVLVELDSIKNNSKEKQYEQIKELIQSEEETLNENLASFFGILSKISTGLFYLAAILAVFYFVAFFSTMIQTTMKTL